MVANFFYFDIIKSTLFHRRIIMKAQTPYRFDVPKDVLMCSEIKFMIEEALLILFLKKFPHGTLEEKRSIPTMLEKLKGISLAPDFTAVVHSLHQTVCKRVNLPHTRLDKEEETYLEEHAPIIISLIEAMAE